MPIASPHTQLPSPHGRVKPALQLLCVYPQGGFCGTSQVLFTTTSRASAIIHKLNSKEAAARKFYTEERILLRNDCVIMTAVCPPKIYTYFHSMKVAMVLYGNHCRDLDCFPAGFTIARELSIPAAVPSRCLMQLNCAYMNIFVVLTAEKCRPKKRRLSRSNRADPAMK